MATSGLPALQTARKSLLLSLRNVYETLAVSAPTVVDATRGRLTKEVCDERLERWASCVVRNSEMMITVHGREHIENGSLSPGTRHADDDEDEDAAPKPLPTYVVMSNHQSHYDIAVLYYVLGANIRMVAKKELFDLPLFGRAIREAGFIEVDRKNTEKAIRSLEGAKEFLARGTHLWIAPEGTRSPTGKLMPFKKGGFMIAMRMGAPILPITIRGTRESLPARGVLSKAGVDVHVTIHPPIPVPLNPANERAARDALIRDVRAAIESAL